MTNAILEFDAGRAHEEIEALARVLHDCVEGGASISFMWPFTLAEAHDYWESILGALEHKRLRLYAATRDGAVCGSVQLWLDGPCNQRHRGDIRKLLVHRSARRHGFARALMIHAQHEARALGLSLLTLDTVTGSPAEELYGSLGWCRAGVVPRYAKWPDGRFCDATILYKELIPPA